MRDMVKFEINLIVGGAGVITNGRGNKSENNGFFDDRFNLLFFSTKNLVGLSIAITIVVLLGINTSRRSDILRARRIAQEIEFFPLVDCSTPQFSDH